MAIPLSVTIQTAIKWIVRRQRPYHVIDGVEQTGHILDTHSFPSGHCLHAMMFTVLLGHNLDLAFAVLMTISMLIFLSRPALGIHYVTDVLGGIIIGLAVAFFSLDFVYPHAVTALSFVKAAACSVI